MVEALTIVVAAGVTRGWRSAIEGSAVAVLVLAVLVVAVGVPLARLVPINVLRVVIGSLLLVLGLDWLRKAVLRASGHKALHDEDAIYARTVQELSVGVPVAAGLGEAPAGQPTAASWRHGRRDATGFTVAFKGVFLEGMEVVLIVITLGADSGHLALAAAAAAAAAVVVGVVGLLVARQLSEIPENSMKLAVGVMLDELRGVLGRRGGGRALAGQRPHDPGAGRGVRRQRSDPHRSRCGDLAARLRPGSTAGTCHMTASSRRWRAFGRFWKDFLIGDAPELFIGTLAVVGAAFALRHRGYVAVVVVPLVAVGFLTGSVLRGRAKGDPSPPPCAACGPGTLSP